MTNIPTIRPPPEFDHLRWHWITHPANGQRPAYWGESKIMWAPWDGPNSLGMNNAKYSGWRYHGPCVPTAIIPDPDNAEMVECGATGVAKEYECQAAADLNAPLCMDDGACVCRRDAHAVLTALRDWKVK